MEIIMFNRLSHAVAWSVAASIFAAPLCFGAEIRVWSGGAVTSVMNVLVPQFEQQTGHKVQFRIMNVGGGQLQQRLAAGERGEMTITALSDIDQLIKDGSLRAPSRAVLGSVGIALVVREGASQPDISTPEKFRKVLLDARKIVQPRPDSTPSGAYLVEIFQQLGVTEAMRPKVILRNVVDGGAEEIIKGEVDFGLFPASAMIPIKGITVAALLPREVQRSTVFGAGIMANNPSPEPAMAFIRFVTDPANQEPWKRAGFEPPARH
jgi:molybdate transport system substrate-binding protein